MKARVVGALIITVFSIIFTVQNAVPIAVNFLFWKFEASLAIVLLITFVLGLLMGVLTFVPGKIRKSLETFKQKKQEVQEKRSKQ